MSPQAQEALEATRKFVHGYCADTDGLDQIKAELMGAVQFNPEPIKKSLQALETVLRTSYPEGTLARLVAWDANWPLDDPSDAGARAFLTQFADLVRSVIDEAGSHHQTEGVSQ